MKKLLISVAMIMLFVFAVNAQSTKIERKIQPTGGQVTDTLDNGQVVTLDLSSDDAEQENNEVDTPYDDDLDAGWEGAPDDQNILTMGLRFTDLNIPQGAVIDSAFIRVHSHEGKLPTDVANITIFAEAADSAVSFDSANFNANYLLTDRPVTNDSLEWIVDEQWYIWEPYRTPDIANVVQNVVDRSGWKSGNAIAFILTGEDQGPSTDENAREMEAFENISDPEDQDTSGTPGDGQNHPERVPELIVYYTTVGVNNATMENELNVYPNPVENGTLGMELTRASNTSIRLINLKGEVVRAIETNNTKTRLNVKNLDSGMYLLNVVQGEDSFIKKIIIQ